MACCTWTIMGYLILIPITGFLIKYLFSQFQAYRMEKMLERWSKEKTPRDVVILHSIPRGISLPSVSPFVLKVETYLRMAGIKYEMDMKDTFGPKGKTPWISLNGQHIPDSEFIVEFLAKKFDKSFTKNLSKEQVAISTLARVVLEEHFFWGIVLERLVFNGRQHLHKLMKIPFLFLAKTYLYYHLQSKSKAQGLGLHTEDEIVHLMKKDLRAVSAILGTKTFMCGDTPNEIDCAIFGVLAQIIYALPQSPYERLIKDELQNLERYVNSMRQKFWPDWDQLIDRN